jgi:hypothetical protein
MAKFRTQDLRQRPRIEIQRIPSRPPFYRVTARRCRRNSLEESSGDHNLLDKGTELHDGNHAERRLAAPLGKLLLGTVAIVVVVAMVFWR